MAMRPKATLYTTTWGAYQRCLSVAVPELTAAAWGMGE